MGTAIVGTVSEKTIDKVTNRLINLFHIETSFVSMVASCVDIGRYT